MAKATVVCGSCGAPVTPGDEVCSQCGSELEWHERGEQKAAPPEKPSIRRKERQKERPAGSGKKIEIWQIISLVAFVALIAFLVYNEASRQSTRITSESPGNTPTQTPRVMVDLTPLEQAVAANPKDTGSLLHLANGLQDNGLYQRAIETYKKYLALRPKDPDARVDLGICYYQLGVSDKANAGHYYGLAIGEMQQAHTDAPSHQPAVFNMGVVSLQLGNIKEATQWFQLAASMNPSSELGKRAEQMLKEHQFPQ